ncbi:MAG: (5-formylfuran-3-yl)methyl phosphate synthase [Candidatus Thorarchaeota archaeon]
MKLLVSPKSVIEAQECIQAEVDIIDVKNPDEGSLGANFPWVIKKIRELAPTTIPISATIGDISYKPGSVSLAALGAATAGASYVKVGLYQITTIAQGIEIMKAVRKTIDEFHLPVKIVASGYAEGTAIGSLPPEKIPQIASEANSDYVMLDTYDKTKGKTIFDLLSNNFLAKFIADAKAYKLGVALGGSINLTHLNQLQVLQPDIVGIRGAVCDNNDRIKGEMKEHLIQQFLTEIRKI